MRELFEPQATPEVEGTGICDRGASVWNTSSSSLSISSTHIPMVTSNTSRARTSTPGPGGPPTVGSSRLSAGWRRSVITYTMPDEADVGSTAVP